MIGEERKKRKKKGRKLIELEENLTMDQKCTN